jgi:RNA polymerase sigma factor (sigma-70 family)
MAGAISPDEPSSADRADGREVDGSTTYLKYEAAIERVIRTISRRLRLSESDAPDFAQDARLWLIRGGIISRFEYRSSFVTFLFTAMFRFGVSWHQSRRGRWRSSALARRLGPDAIAAERLLSRDHLTEREVVEVLGNIGSKCPSEIIDLVRTITANLGHRRSAPVLPQAASWGEPETAMRDREADAATDRVRHALAETLAGLSPQERELLSMRFTNGQKISALAVLMGVDQRRVYIEFAQLLRKVRAAIVARGVVREDIECAIGRLDYSMLKGSRSASWDPMSTEQRRNQRA